MKAVLTDSDNIDSLSRKSKYLLKVGNKAIIEHILEQLQGLVEEVIVVGNKEHFKDYKVKVIEKKDEIKDKFILMDLGLFNKEDIVNAINTGEKVKCSFPIKYPWDLLEANEFLLKDIKSKSEGEIDKNTTIKGNLIVGKNTKILPGVYIEGNVIIGENCDIGPNCYIRGSTSIGNNCKVGQAVEIKNSILMDGSKVPHLSYVGDSVIGENANLGAGTIIANLRHDNQNVKSEVKGELLDSGRRKFGAIIGDNVHIGINTSILPGRKIWPGLTTAPGEIVKRDIKEDK